MYTETNFKSKKALREAVEAGQKVTVFATGLGTPKENGVAFLEGPHYPAPHTWCAKVTMENGKVVKVHK